MRSPFELEALIEWLGKQQADDAYPWVDADSCLIAQYAASIGLGYDDVPSRIRHSGWEEIVSFPLPHTFGAALDRARALASESVS